MYIQKFKERLKEYLNLAPFLFWKGRVALYAILKALDLKPGDEVILPAFTCVVVPNPIIYLGLKPVYADIDPFTFTLKVEEIEKKITHRTRAIIAQNTFGLPADIEPIMELTKKYNLFVVEDAAHGFGSKYKGKKAGTVADATFFSTQWNKPFSTGIGGIAVTTREELAQKLKKLEEKAAKPSLKEELFLKTLLKVREKFLTPKVYWTAVKIYRKLSEWNLILGSSQGYELEKPVEPPNFLKGFTETQAKEGLKYFQKEGEEYKIDKIIKHRKKVAKLYREILTELGFEPPYEPSYAEHTYLKFPLLVKNREKFFRLAQEKKIELGDWFLSPIHPIRGKYELWYYRYGENPIGEFASRHIVNLPTHERIDENYVNIIYEFLKENKDEIIGCSVPKNYKEYE